MKRNKKGFALVTTMILSFIALALLVTINYFLNTGSYISSTEKQYTGSLESARGVADFIIKQIEWDENGDVLQCDNGNTCSANSVIDLGSYSSLGNYNITATMLSTPVETEVTSGGVTTYYTIYSFRVIATSQSDSSKKAIIDVVYELEQ